MLLAALYSLLVAVGRPGRCPRRPPSISLHCAISRKMYTRRTTHAHVFNIYPSGCGFSGRKVRCRSPHCPTHENIVSSTVVMVPCENTLVHNVFNLEIHVSIKEMLLASVFPIYVSVWHLKNRFHCRNLVADTTHRNVNEYET
jgi:hypothetical protein